MDLLLIRHCAATGQEPDAPLTAQGSADARDLAVFLAAERVDALHASPFVRAVSTLAPYAAAAGLPINHDARLQERVLSPTPRADWLTHLETSFRDHAFRLEGGESIAEAQARGIAALAAIAAAGNSRPAVASHGNLIAAIFAAIDPAFGFESWRGMANPDIYRLTLDGGAPLAFRRVTHAV